MHNKTEPPNTWWGSFTLNDKRSQKWHIGPLTLIVQCLNGEWQIAYEREETMTSDEGLWHVSETDQLPESLAIYERYIFRETSGLLTITPQLADRPVISRPLTPFNLTAGEQATLYISSPLWLALSVGENHKKLTEIGIQRPSDTWFGPSTREGELCYASTTSCHLNLNELPLRAHRAITPVVICNQADSTLSVERLNLPAPLLSLYMSGDGRLWTPSITLTREKDGDMAALKISSHAPDEAGDAIQLNKPRKSSSDNVLIRAFNTVFS